MLPDKNKLKCNFEKEHQHSFYSTDPVQNTILDLLVNFAEHSEKRLSFIEQKLSCLEDINSVLQKEIKVLHSNIDFLKEQITQLLRQQSQPKVGNLDVKNLQSTLDNFTKKLNQHNPDLSESEDIKALTDQISSLSLEATSKDLLIKNRPPKPLNFIRFKDIYNE